MLFNISISDIIDKLSIVFAKRKDKPKKEKKERIEEDEDEEDDDEVIIDNRVIITSSEDAHNYNKNIENNRGGNEKGK